MLTFVRNENGKAEAMAGTHDDLIMALAISYYCRGQCRMSIKANKVKLPDNLPADVRADLEKDPAMMQLYMEQNGLV
jgi:hypothetical protein